MADRVLTKKQALGMRAEQLAADYLEQRGYEILARNWRRPEGELDLVVSAEGLCVFVEVRSRTGTERGHPLETVDARKRARVLRAARMYIDEERPKPRSFASTSSASPSLSTKARQSSCTSRMRFRWET
jgi:putative endonuclease